MNPPREIRPYPLWLVATVSAGFGVAYVLPHAAVALAGALLLATPALLASALLRPIIERSFWVQVATLTLLAVVPLLSGVSGMYGVHLLAGLCALVAGLLFWGLSETRRQWAGLPTAMSLAVTGLSLMTWAWFAPVTSRLDAALEKSDGTVVAQTEPGLVVARSDAATHSVPAVSRTPAAPLTSTYERRLAVQNARLAAKKRVDRLEYERRLAVQNARLAAEKRTNRLEHERRLAVQTARLAAERQAKRLEYQPRLTTQNAEARR